MSLQKQSPSTKVTTQEVRLFEDKEVIGKRLELSQNCLLAITLLYEVRKTFQKLEKCAQKYTCNLNNDTMDNPGFKRLH